MTEAATTAVLPLWLEIIVAVLVLSGAGIALLGSTGLLRLRTFFERVHAPAIIATLGCWLIMHGTVLYFSVADRSLALHALLCRLFRIDADTFVITSVAAILSPAFVPMAARALRNPAVLMSGMTTGILGFAIGNYLGIAVALILARGG